MSSGPRATVTVGGQARQLGREISQAELELAEGAGHMVHSAAAGQVTALVERIAAAGGRASRDERERGRLPDAACAQARGARRRLRPAR